MSDNAGGELIHIIRQDAIYDAWRMDVLVTTEYHDGDKYFVTRLGSIDEKKKFNTAGSGMAREKNISFAIALENFASNIKHILKSQRS